MSKASLSPRKPKGARSARCLGMGVVLATALAGCPSSSQEEAPVVSIEERAAALLADEAPDRDLIASLSEDLAREAAQAEPEATTRWLTLAADLRSRAFRTQHQVADASAALALYASAAQAKGAGACEAALRRTMLLAEIKRDPELLYREIHLARQLFSQPGCASSGDALLSRLRAYRPDEATLEQLEREARGHRGGGAEGVANEAGEALLVAEPAEAVGPRRIDAIDPYGSRDRARVVVTLSGEARFQAASLPRSQDAPARVYIDLAVTEADSRELEVAGIVERLRLAPRKEGSRLVLDLAAPASHRVFTLPEPFRVIIDIATEATEKPAVPQGAPRPIRRVAIDPGHGGHDPGAVGPSGLREKDVALDIAHRVAPIMARELGIITLLTRDDDRFVPLAERTARANAFHADLFISIHCNASESSSARGVATFVFDTTRDENLAKIAARENAISLSASLGLDGMGTLGPREVSARSRKLAELLDRSTMASLAPKWADTSSYGVKAAGFFVLVGAEMPSVLFETSFISNPLEEARLGTPEYRQKLADAIVNAVRAYREGR